MTRTRGAKQTRTTAARRGPKPRTLMPVMEIGDVYHVEVPTPADVKRVARNVSQYGIRHDKGFRCRTNLETRIMAITRVR